MRQSVGQFTDYLNIAEAGAGQVRLDAGLD